MVAVAVIGLWPLRDAVDPAFGGAAEGSLEYPVKAAFLLNFAKFSEWPADSLQARAPAVSICVLGRDPFGDILEKAVVGRSVGGRPIVIERPRNVDGARACHVLFIANSEVDRLTLILERLAAEPIVTVGESKGFAHRGGVIGLVVEDNLARFEVNLRSAQRSGLLLSSKLLGVARVIEGLPAGER